MYSFVTAIRAENSFETSPTIFRSYSAGPNAPISTCKVWEAIRATTAAPTYFKAMTIGGISYVDAGIYWNNPAREVMAEAAELWGAKFSLNLFLSLGTGKRRSNTFAPAIGRRSHSSR